MKRMPPLMPVAEALQHILDETPSATRRRRRPLPVCCNRVLAEDLVAPQAVPPHTNAALDGYALCAADLPSDTPRSYPVAGSAFAGKPFRGVLRGGEVLRVMTGAVLPAAADTVVPWEQVELSGGGERVQIGPGHGPGQNVRAAGEDIAAGEVALSAGTRLLAPELGIAASLGSARLAVFAAPLATVLSSGDELCEPGGALAPGTGAVYDSNRFLLQGLLARLGPRLRDGGILRDRARVVAKALRDAAAASDFVVITGGASGGAADFAMEALGKLGERKLWGVALRPGRPFGFGLIGAAPVFVLPGNPVAVATTFLLLVAPAVRRMMGERQPFPCVALRARCLGPFPKKPRRTDVYRAILEHDDEGKPVVRATRQQGSGMLLSLGRANCLVVLDHDDPPAEPGDEVKVYPLQGLL